MKKIYLVDVTDEDRRNKRDRRPRCGRHQPVALTIAVPSVTDREGLCTLQNCGC